MRLSTILPIAGVSIIAASMTLRAPQSWRGRPGRLVATNPEIIRQAPAVGVGGAEGAPATFEVTNLGGRPVRILGIESGCGCTTPTVTASLVAPGKKSEIKVEALPFPIGERRVHLVLHTDSPITPRVPLHLRMIGNRRPPFLLGIEGDLTFIGDQELDTGRELLVLTVESQGHEDGKRPILKSDLPLRFEPRGTEAKPYVAPGTVLVTSKYEVFLNSQVNGTISGEIRAIDPWLEDHVETIRVLASATPGLRAIPTSLVLNYGEDDRGIEPARLVVMTAGSAAQSRVGPEDEGRSPILVERLPIGASDRICMYDVRWRPGVPIRPGRYEIIVRESPASSHRLIVPVTVRKGGDR